MSAAGPDSFFWWDWVARRPEEVWTRALQHVQQTAIAVGIGLAISLALAALGVRYRWALRPVTWLSAVLYTIPSLALFAVLIPVTGLTLLTAQIALVSYTLYSLVPNIVAGIDGVPRDVLDAADGLGFTRVRRFWQVEVPLAAPQIIAGLRIATVSTIGLVTISSYVALGGGFGSFIKDGYRRGFSTPLVLGIAGSILLAVLFDLIFVLVGALVMPWRRRARGRVP